VNLTCHGTLVTFMDFVAPEESSWLWTLMSGGTWAGI
jgi:hypothetical protein